MVIQVPPGGGARALGVLSPSTIDVCRNGELMSILSLPNGSSPPFAGDEEP